MGHNFLGKYFVLFAATVCFGLLSFIFYFSLSLYPAPFFAALVGNTTQATLSVTPPSGTFAADDNFSVSVYLNTNSQNVVVVAAYLNYDKTHFQVISIDTINSVFTIEAEKVIDPVNGVIKITRGNPSSSHVNSANALVAVINFRAISGVSPSSDNLMFQFTPGSTAESNVILDDGQGTDILSGVYNGQYTVTGGTEPPPTQDTQAPSVPGSLSATAISSSQINLSWSASTDNVGVSGYRVFRNGAQIGTSAANSYQNTGLSPATNYNYTVTAYDSAGNESAQSSQASATTQSSGEPPPPPPPPSPQDTDPPTVPANLSATAVSSSQINLIWSASSDNVGVAGYRVYRNNVEISTTPSPSYSDFGLSPANTYTYSVSAYDSAGNGSYASSQASATTQSSTSGPPPQQDITPPAISSVNVYSITSNSATITWATNEAADSQVEYGPTSGYGSQSSLNYSKVTSHSVLLSGLSPSTTYHYRAKSTDSAGNQGISPDYTFNTTAANASLAVTLVAAPQTGDAPLSGVDLSAAVSGSAGGNINYIFYCNRSDTGTNVTSPNKARHDNQSNASFTASDVCSYSAAGSYTAKVIVERGGLKAEARAQIVVNAKERTTAAKNYQPFGFIDQADQKKVTGWAYDRNAGNGAVTVKVFIDDKLSATFAANLSRPDVVGAGGVIKEAEHGFGYDLPGLSSGPHTIRVYAVDVPSGNDVELGSSPKTVDASDGLSKIVNSKIKPFIGSVYETVSKKITTSPILMFLSLFVVTFWILKKVFY